MKLFKIFKKSNLAVLVSKLIPFVVAIGVAVPVQAENLFVTNLNPLVIEETPLDSPLKATIDCGKIQQGNLVSDVITSNFFDQRRFPGTNGDNNIPMDIYLPPNYSASESYPILVILSGGSGFGTEWQNPDKINVLEVIDVAVACNLMDPSIVVFPVGEGPPITLYSNADPLVDPTFQWREYYEQELLPFVASKYNGDLSRKYIAGNSLGGAGSLKISTTPRVETGGAYKGVGIFSPCIQYADTFNLFLVTRPQGYWNALFGTHYGLGLVGLDRITPALLASNPIESLKAFDVSQSRWYVAAGDNDMVGQGTLEAPALCDVIRNAAEINRTLTVKGAKDYTSYNIDAGEHTHEFWHDHALEMIMHIYDKQVTLEK